MAQRDLAGEFMDEGAKVNVKGEDVRDGEVVRSMVRKGLEEVIQ